MDQTATNTATETPQPSGAEARPLPALTPLELDVALAFIESGEPTTTTLAASLDLHPAELLEIASRPHVIRWGEAVLAVEQVRADILARRSQSAALQALTEVVQDQQRDPVERRRAATAILRTTNRRPPRTAGATDECAEPPSPLATLKQFQCAALPAPVHQEPESAQIFQTITGALARASATDPEAFKPIQQRCARPLREASILDFLARTQLHRAAGAECIEHHVFDEGAGRAMQATFATETGPLTLHFTCHNCGVTSSRWRITRIATIDETPDPDDPGADDEAPDEPDDDVQAIEGDDNFKPLELLAALQATPEAADHLMRALNLRPP